MNKVFLQNKSISFISKDIMQYPDDNELIVRFDESNEANLSFQLLKSDTKLNKITLFGNNIQKCFGEFKSLFIIEKAAGGIVKNEENKLLLIYRNDHWDLPKGHIEKGETEEQAAIREVKEECSLHNISLGKKIDDTYHVFEKDGNYVLKQTAWFEMTVSGNTQPIPQTEEGIEKAEWKSREEMIALFGETYASIVALIKEHIIK